MSSYSPPNKDEPIWKIQFLLLKPSKVSTPFTFLCKAIPFGFCPIFGIENAQPEPHFAVAPAYGAAASESRVLCDPFRMNQTKAAAQGQPNIQQTDLGVSKRKQVANGFAPSLFCNPTDRGMLKPAEERRIGRAKRAPACIARNM